MQKANPTAVGGFVIGAVLLATAAVAIFGGGQFFQERILRVAFFDETQVGLRLGAPVTFRGVNVGTVTEIWVRIDPGTLTFEVPVLFDLQIDRVRGLSGISDEGLLDDLVERGLRAQLNQDSFVTGQQSILLDFFPGTPIKLVETELPYDQFPTVPSKTAQLEGSVRDIAQQADVVLRQIEVLLRDENQQLITMSLQNLSALLDELGGATADAREAIHGMEALADDLRDPETGIPSLVGKAGVTLDTYDALGRNADVVVSEIKSKIGKVLEDFEKAESRINVFAERATKFLEENQKALKDFCNEGLYEITNLAIDAQAAVEQFRRVMEEMERDPARFFLGKPGQVEVE